MVQFTKLRLTGFKSFVDTTELEIGAGMTGIIGPNGCGKSNLVEALRWVMGETSAKRMRGSGMEDVIFNGTDKRPARNNADVTLWLDNTDRKAPAELNHSDELEILRKIGKDAGSTYKVNGKTVRARDVQLLFADSSIGANSPALVSQGRVADLISAKPTKRRLILEEAAGISGLHVRKHEAELKLRAAETNLTRVEDVVGNMSSQLDGLKKQARQANRYRNLSGHIQQADATVLHLKYTEADTAVAVARKAFDEAEGVVREQTIIVTNETTKQTDGTSKLPELRKLEATAAAALQRLRLAHGALESEEQQIIQEQAQAKHLLSQAENDIAHATELKTEAKVNVQKLNAEQEELLKSNNNEDAKVQTQESLISIQDMVTDLDLKLETLTNQTATAEAEKNTLTHHIETLAKKQISVEERLSSFKQDHKDLIENTPAQQQVKDIEQEITIAEETYNTSKSILEKAELHRQETDGTVTNTTDTMQADKQAHGTLTAEQNALQNILLSGDDQNFEPVLDKLNVTNGFEQALAVALGDDLQAALDDNAPIYWQDLPALSDTPALPDGASPLSDHVTSPKALARVLSQIGVVENDVDAEKLISKLNPGQSLVTKEGAAWRWDGLTVKADAKQPAAIRLEQKNRLVELDIEVTKALKTLETSQTNVEKAKEQRDLAVTELTNVRTTGQEAEQNLNQLRHKHHELNQSLSQTMAQITRLETNIQSLEEEGSEISETLATTKSDLDSIKDTQDARTEISNLRETLSEKRTELAEQQAHLDNIERENNRRQTRITDVKSEIDACQDRYARADERLKDLNTRTKTARETLELLEQKPAELIAKKQELLDKISIAEEARQLSADTLVKAESLTNDIGRALKDAENILSDAREARAMAQAGVSTAQHTQNSVSEQIREKFDCSASALPEKFDIDVEKISVSDISATQSKLERLIRERDNMGPVNLRAEVEAQELGSEMGTMETEREDLLAAITKLRQGISHLNKEARERLLGAFEAVNKHFTDLFQRLFGGGTAYLELVGSDDPLEAGLEIFAQPPGKKLQVLSLFSGGEQTLTSIALIFGMFLTNPAPICVLDEIDAPLDDSNVDRVCSLLESLTETTDTRFIVITHHRMTMARMDRLYGVTMSERGVSQLVSVDLRQPDLLDGLAA